MTTCAFDPLKPNELTAAARGVAPRFHGSPPASGIRMCMPSQSTIGVGTAQCRCGGIISCCSDSTTFATPITPEGRRLSAPEIHIPATLPMPNDTGLVASNTTQAQP